MQTRILRRLIPAVLTLLCSSSLAHANDWPRWRGPDGDNVSKETGWSSIGKAEPAWRAQIGWGYSSPVVADGRVYTTGYFENEETPREGSDRVTCFDARTGQEIWRHEYPTHAFDNEHGGGALSTPTVFEGHVYVATRGGEVRRYVAQTGELTWEVDLVERHEVATGRYGFASSPFVLGDALVLNASRCIALDRDTGETLWISDPYDANYSTIAPLTLGERDCLAVFGGLGLAVIDAGTGEHVHTYAFRRGQRNVEGATPIVLGERVVISSAYEQGIALIDFSGDEPREIWRNRTLRTKMAGATLFDGHLYGFDESMLKCIDLEGNEKWRVRGLGHGAHTVADGRLLVTTSDGELIVAPATPDGFVEASRTQVAQDGVFWTGPVLANGFIYFRGSHGDLVCLDHRASEAGAPAATKELAHDGPLPEPQALVRQHLAKCNLAAAPSDDLRMSGILNNDSLGLAGVEVVWETSASGHWHANIFIPPYNANIDRYFDGERAWEVSFRGNKLMEADELNELRRTNGFRMIFEPLPERPAQTVGRELFRGTDAFRVDVQLGEGQVRSVYFDAQTGLVAGRTSPKEATVVLGDWREVGDVLLPHHRTLFDPKSGEESRWRFETVEFASIDREQFELPEDLAEQDE